MTTTTGGHGFLVTNGHLLGQRGRSGGGYYGWAPMGPGININININLPARY